MCIVEFSKKFKMPAKMGFNYLKQYGGLDFIDRCYEAEHQISLEETIRDLIKVCKRSGGTLA